jgi:hypothetical protein
MLLRMDRMLLWLFRSHVLEQAEVLAAALERATRDLRAPTVWVDLQQAVLAAGNLSKLLWGQEGKRTEERRPLRESIGVDDSSPLRLPRMRNHFEHMDERLEQWWRESERHNFADRNIGSRNSVEGLSEKEHFRWYDPETGILSFWGDQLDLREIGAEVIRILPGLRESAHRGWWE